LKYNQRLIEGVFLKRYKRFFADVELGIGNEKKVEVAHIANTGSMKSLNNPGSPCLVSPATNPERKLRYSLEAIRATTGAWVGVNTSLPNHLVQEAFENNKISHWLSYDEFKREVKINSETRLDAMLTKGKHKHYVEVKSVTMASVIEGRQIAQFPDAETERGQKHLRELMSLLQQGHSAEIFFVVQRGDCEEFRPADDIDPEYGQLLRDAAKAGVVISAYKFQVDPEGITLCEDKLKVIL
jgi:sugar fermentation stimulation protein A